MANLLGVPAHKLGADIKSSYNSLEQENQDYLDQCLDFWLVRWEEECWDKLLTEEEKELGVCLVDIGGGTTDIAIFNGGAIAHTAVIALGGNNLTNDIAVGLRTPVHEAERIKGEPEHPHAPAELERKFLTLVGPSWRGGSAAALDQLQNIDRAASVRDLGRELRAMA